MMEPEPTDFPLAWPAGRERTPQEKRIEGRFTVSFEAAYDGLVADAERLHEEEEHGAREVVISTDVPLDARGLPIIALRRVDDPGVAVYLRRGGRPYVIACDTYREVHHNMRAISATLTALRAIQRHGTVTLMEQSLFGFREISARPPGLRLLPAAEEAFAAPPPGYAPRSGR